MSPVGPFQHRRFPDPINPYRDILGAAVFDCRVLRYIYGSKINFKINSSISSHLEMLLKWRKMRFPKHCCKEYSWKLRISQETVFFLNKEVQENYFGLLGIEPCACCMEPLSFGMGTGPYLPLVLFLELKSKLKYKLTLSKAQKPLEVRGKNLFWCSWTIPISYPTRSKILTLTPPGFPQKSPAMTFL